MRDSNPRYPERGIPDFESSAFGHSANLPLSLVECKSNTFSLNDKILGRFFNYINDCLVFLGSISPYNSMPKKNFFLRHANIFLSAYSNFSIGRERILSLLGDDGGWWLKDFLQENMYRFFIPCNMGVFRLPSSSLHVFCQTRSLLLLQEAVCLDGCLGS